jgi:hypothetical protein
LNFPEKSLGIEVKESTIKVQLKHMTFLWI